MPNLADACVLNLLIAVFLRISTCVLSPLLNMKAWGLWRNGGQTFTHMSQDLTLTLTHRQLALLQ